MQNEIYSNTQSAVNGRVLIELRDGKITIFPVTETDEQTRVLLGAILDHIADSLRG